MPEETTPNRVEPSQQTKGPKKRLTKSQAVSVMVAGGVILVAPGLCRANRARPCN